MPVLVLVLVLVLQLLLLLIRRRRNDTRRGADIFTAWSGHTAGVATGGVAVRHLALHVLGLAEKNEAGGGILRAGIAFIWRRGWLATLVVCPPPVFK